MKILTLRFKNLASLYGEWEIDFTQPEYTANGIFALLGNTGAGKTTILDAICLALYRETPRLGKITSSTNEIMSRQTGECFAEVSFSCQKGMFLCRWAQHRAKKKANGNLRETEHEIVDLETNKIIESKPSLTSKVIEEKTGVDFKHFTRSMLLAQGSFDSFFKANDEEKSTILEQITGTEIYTHISKEIHKKHSEEKNKLEIKQKELEAISILSTEEEQTLISKVEQTEKQEKGLTEKKKHVETSLLWLEKIASLKQDLEINKEKFIQVTEKKEQFEPKQQQLLLSQKAAELETPYAIITNLRKDIETTRKDLLSKQEIEPQKQEQEKKQSVLLQDAKKNIEDITNKQTKLTSVMQETAVIDNEIKNKETALETSKIKSQDLTIKLANITEKHKKLQSQYKEKKEKLNSIQSYIVNHKEDANLAEVLALIETQSKEFSSLQNEISNKNKEIQEQAENLKTTQHSLEQCSVKVNQKNKLYKSIQEEKYKENNRKTSILQDKSLREYRERKDSLLYEKSLLQKIATYEEERKTLLSGKSCPLCGATEHPYIQNSPETKINQTELETISAIITQVEEIELKIKTLEKTEKQTHYDKTEFEKEKIKIEASLLTTQKDLEQRQKEIDILTTKQQEINHFLTENFESFSIQSTLEININETLEQLKTRSEKWKEQQENKPIVQNELTQIEGEGKVNKTIKEKYTADFKEEDTRLQNISKDLEDLKKQRYTLFGDKNIEEEKKHLQNQIIKAKQKEEQEQDGYATIQKELQILTNEINSLQEYIDKKIYELKDKEIAFLTNCNEQGFADENSFLKNKLTSEERKALIEEENSLKKEIATLQAQKELKEVDLQRELQKKITETSKEMLIEEKQKLQEILKTQQGNIANYRLILNNNKEKQSQIQEQQTNLVKQKKEYTRWKNLHDLIGSADGKKYRTFVQGLTFKAIVEYANQELAEMTDRYLLLHNNTENLELNVIDNYQASEIRPTKNLSGGESFLVSLSLALGLSKMNSQKIRIDSLFLDEGFGTLDEETLEFALQALSRLQQNGKLIGIISHISSLKERISTQIQVITTSNGKSTIVGFGVTKMN